MYGVSSDLNPTAIKPMGHEKAVQIG